MRVPIQEDTIAAIATGTGGAIAILRLSGARALAIARRVWRGRPGLGVRQARRLLLGRLHDEAGQPLDQALAVYMPGPHSYTGEAVVELHLHGGPVLARAALALVLRHGARHAEPGEFTRRAFLNGKLDLTQAEAVHELIIAQTELAAHSATRQMQGHLRRTVEGAHALLVSVLAEVEVRMDFVEEDLDWQPPAWLSERVTQAQAVVATLLASRHTGELLREGLALVIAGAPNAGKSSLLNLLLGRERALVTPIAGTTRDTLEEGAQIRGIPLRLVDTAGLRQTSDPVEQAGIARGVAAIQSAELLLWVLDATRDLAEQTAAPDLVAHQAVLAVINKSDLQPNPPWLAAIRFPWVRLTALTGDGFNELADAIERLAWGQPRREEPEHAISARHAEHLEAARQSLVEAQARLKEGHYELLAVNLRGALEALGRITGRSLQPDILDTIFHRFCIGK